LKDCHKIKYSTLTPHKLVVRLGISWLIQILDEIGYKNMLSLK